METLIAVGVCVIAGIVVLGPIIKHVIKVERYDDSQWYVNNAESELDSSNFINDDSVPTDKQ